MWYLIDDGKTLHIYCDTVRVLSLLLTYVGIQTPTEDSISLQPLSELATRCAPSSECDVFVAHEHFLETTHSHDWVQPSIAEIREIGSSDGRKDEALLLLITSRNYASLTRNTLSVMAHYSPAQGLGLLASHGRGLEGLLCLRRLACSQAATRP